MTSEPGAVQTAYAIQVSPSQRFGDELVWDSGQVTSDAPFGVVYAGAPLSSRRRYFWRVRVWDGQDAVSAWSDPAWFETALLDAGKWAANWISSESPSSKQDDSALYLRGSVELSAEDLSRTQPG